MKKKFFLNFKPLLAALLLISLCLSSVIPVFAAGTANAPSASQGAAQGVVADEYDATLYEEDFDGVSGKLELSTGKNDSGWIYHKGTSASKGSAYIQDGRFYFSGDRYDYVYLDGGENWKNYILEADFCYTADSATKGWAGLLYNVIRLNDTDVMAQKGGTLMPIQDTGYTFSAALNGTKNLGNGYSTWSNNAAQNQFKLENAGLAVPGKGDDQAYRIKIVSYENTATLYYAFLDGNGEMATPYVKIMSIDNIPSDAQHGSIGIMSSGNGLFASCWVDNIKCQKLLYEESFDGITDKQSVASGATGNEKFDALEGWSYNKYGSASEAYVKDGRLYMKGSTANYDVLYRAEGSNWKNYTVEADFCYNEDNSGWGGILYNVQESGKKYQKGGISITGDATLNGMGTNGIWTNNNMPDSTEPTKNHYDMNGKLEVPAVGQPFRMKISVYNETAALYYALLNDDGTMKTPFKYIMTVDNIPINNRMGTIGFMTSAWNNNASFWVDNIRCYENVIVNYFETFDDVQQRVDLQPGNNLSDAAKGWIFNKKSDNAKAYIENGKLYFTGSLYDVLYRDGGEVWGNYSLEADFCYESNNEYWGGILYNVQDNGNRFQKAGITTAGLATLNGNEGGVWTNNDTSINHYSMKNNADLVIPQKGEAFRMKVTVYNKTATLYYAMLNGDGTLKTPFKYVMSIDNIPADNQTGSIGLMTSGNNQLTSFWVDNIKCYSDNLVSYSENFDSYANYTITGNAIDTTVGFYFDRNGTSADDSKAEVKDGALYLYGGTSSYDALFFTTGDNWTNYVVESDFTYLDATSVGLNNDGWAGILFRSNSVNNFYKGGIELSKDGVAEGVLNGKLNNGWHMDDLNATRGSYNGTVELGTTYRLRIVVNESTASLYMAAYTNGVLGEWTRVVTITDRFAPIHMKGTIGLIVGGGTDERYRSVKIDNVTVSQIPGADRAYQEPNAANIYEAETGIVNPPVVVEKLTETLPATTGERAAVVMMEIDANLNVLGKNGAVLETVSNFISTYRKVLIPAFIVDNEAEADALASLLGSAELSDCYVMATESNAGLVKRVRMANETTGIITGAIIFDDLNSLSARQNARATVSDNMSYVAISKAPLSEEAAFYFAARQIAAWSFADSTAEVYRGIANGYHGIVSENVSQVYDVYESITETTVSGQTVVIAHRGANTGAVPQYPENTLMGIRAAKEIFGADGIEIDFGLTKDGYVVLMHDDTVDRTTDGSGKLSSFTLAELQKLTVDYVAGKETTVPTLEEVLELAKELDVVLYCHVKDVTDANLAAFSHLVEKHGCQDNVLLFAGAMSSYNSNSDRVYNGTPYELNNGPVVPEGIVFTAETLSVLTGCPSHIEGVVNMRNALNKYNYQPLFYPYLNQGELWRSESFYYQLSARGFVNTHSITDGQSRMDKLALTESGCVGWLTNNPQCCDDYHYAIDLGTEKLTLKVGEAISLNKTLKLIKGSVNAECGFVQIGGKELVAVSGGYTLAEQGSVTIVYYATRKADGGSTYRIYSEPVTLTFVDESVANFKVKTSVTLDSNLIFNIYIPAHAGLGTVTLDGAPVDLGEANEGYYVISTPLAAAEAARELKLVINLTVDGTALKGSFTFSTVKYAEKLLADGSISATEKALAKDMLNYIDSAYKHFNGDAVLDAPYASGFNIASAEAKKTVPGLSGATFVLDAKPAVRFYFADGYSYESFTFKVGNRALTEKDIAHKDATYVEFSLYAYEMTEDFTYTVGGESGAYNLASYYAYISGEGENDYDGEDKATLTDLVAKFYNYCASAKAYRDSVIGK